MGRRPRDLADRAELSVQARNAMPLRLELVDPVNGQTFVVEKGDVLSALRINPSKILEEASIVSRQYAEFARAQRACEARAGRAEVVYRQWKAQRAIEAREASEKKLTGAQVEEAYRTHADYESMASEESRWHALAGLFDDLKWAVRMKSDRIRDFITAQGARVRTEIDDLEDHARKVFADQSWRGDQQS